MAQAQLNSTSDSLDEETQLDDEVRPPDPPFSTSLRKDDETTCTGHEQPSLYLSPIATG